MNSRGGGGMQWTAEREWLKETDLLCSHPPEADISNLEQVVSILQAALLHTHSALKHENLFWILPADENGKELAMANTSLRLRFFDSWGTNTSLRLRSFDIWRTNTSLHIRSFDSWGTNTSLRLCFFDSWGTNTLVCLRSFDSLGTNKFVIIRPFDSWGTNIFVLKQKNHLHLG